MGNFNSWTILPTTYIYPQKQITFFNFLTPSKNSFMPSGDFYRLVLAFVGGLG